MKCKNCNGQYKTRELKCPYCGTENLIGRLWLIERNEIEQQYEDAKEEIKRKTIPYVIDRVLNRILIIFALVFVLVNILIILINVGYYAMVELDLHINEEKYVQQMEVYFDEKNYAELYVYMEKKNLFNEDNYVYAQAALIYNEFQNFLISKQEIIQMLEEEDFEEKQDYEYRIESILKDANDLFIVRKGIYSDKVSENEELYEICTQDAIAFLVGSLELTEEEVQLVMEEDFSFNGNKENLVEAIIERKVKK